MPTTVRESATPHSKENKQADAGTRLFSKVFSVRRVDVELFISKALKVHLHMYNGNVQQNPLFAASCVIKDLCISPRSRLRFFIAIQIQFTNKPLYRKRLCAQNPVFKIVHQESVEVYLHMHNGNVQQNSLCVTSCVTKDLPISRRVSPTVFYRDANSVLLRAHLCTAVGSMRRTLCSKVFIRRV